MEKKVNVHLLFQPIWYSSVCVCVHEKFMQRILAVVRRHIFSTLAASAAMGCATRKHIEGIFTLKTSIQALNETVDTLFEYYAPGQLCIGSTTSVGSK